MPQPSPRPNIILILCDDVGFSDLGCYGSEIQTPNLDALAAEGVRFTQFYNTARCCPSRASLLTGLYPHQAGMGHMTFDHQFYKHTPDGYVGDLNQRCVTIAQVLKSAGYATYMTGKWHVTKNDQPSQPKDNWPLQRGFDRYYGTIMGCCSYFDPAMLTRDNTVISAFNDPEYSPPRGEPYYFTNAISDETVRFIKEHHLTRDQPFFFYVAYTAAHWPMQALPRDIEKYKGVYDAGYEAIRAARFRREKELGLIDEHWDLSPRAGEWKDISHKEWEARCMEVYAAQIDCMDQGIGRIMQALRDTGEYENTLVLFLQDNGGNLEDIGRGGKAIRGEKPTLPPLGPEAIELQPVPRRTRDGWPMLMGKNVMPGPADTYIAYGRNWANVSNTPFREYKHFVHEGGIATPLIAHWPKGIGRKNTLENQPAHLIDIMATCVALSGAQYPAQFAGEPIVPMQGSNLAPAFHGQSIDRPTPIFWEHEGNRAVRYGKWKLVAKGPAGAWELYDMEADRTEMYDLADRNPDVVLQLARAWEAWAKEAEVIPWLWKPAYRSVDAPPIPATRIVLNPGKAIQSPLIAGKSIAIEADVPRPADGVIVAHHDDSNGYSLSIQNNHVVFAVHRDRQLTTIISDDPVPTAPLHIKAMLMPDASLAMSINGKWAATNDARSSLIDGGVKDDTLILHEPTRHLQLAPQFAGEVAQVAITLMSH